MIPSLPFLDNPPDDSGLSPQGLPTGMDVAPPPPPSPPPPMPTRAPKFSKEFIDVVQDYVPHWLKTSAEMVKAKLDRWKLLQDLYLQKRRLTDWHTPWQTLAENWQVADNKKWQTDFVVSCAPVVHSFTDRLFNILFAQDEYLRVVLEPNLAGQNVEDPDFPTSQKFQALLLQKNRAGFFKTRIYEILTDYALFGTVFAKAYYLERERYRWLMDPMTGQKTSEPIRFEGPLIRLVPLHSILPDWTALHSDVQQWSGIANRMEVPITRVLERFVDGHYDLNREEFEKRFAPEGGEKYDPAPKLWKDSSLTTMLDVSKVRQCTLWEWHGEVPVPKKLGTGTQEVVATFVTDRFDDEPTAGLLIRCDAGPALETGDRPFCVAQFTPLPSPFGTSSVEPNLDIIYYLSHMVNICLDSARLQTNTMLKVRRGRRPHLSLAKGKLGDAIYPGKVWEVDEPTDVMPFEPLQLPMQAMQSIMQYFQHQFEQRTGVSDATLAMSSRTKTATESYQLGQMADIPLEARVTLFVEDLFEPFGTMALGMLQSRLKEPQTINVPDATGKVAIPKIISLDELRTGTYRVQAATNKQDQTKIARMQSIERILPALGNLRMPLLQEGIKIVLSSLVRNYLQMAGIENIDQTLVQIPQEEAQAMLQAMQGPPPPGSEGPSAGPQPHQLGSKGTPLGTDDASDKGGHMQFLQMLANTKGGMQT